ncbi:MAG: ArsB/NhaD family transporter [Firmicutes bacterium]|nr:ArsB/NhaD family transporter [Bacillota bacterium]
MQVDHVIIGILIFIIAYIAIVSEKIHRMIVAVFGAGLMIIFHVLSQEEAISKIDFNTLGLLIGMMILVNIIGETGLFQYLAIKSAKIAKGSPFKILIYFSVITALASGLLDNVTTILLIVPVTLVISDTLKVNPIPYVIAEIMSANIGGAATLIGDPPNIMIGGATGLGFLDFIVNLLPLMTVIFIVTILLLRFIFRKTFVVSEESKKEILSFDEKKAITDKPLLIKSLIVLFFTIAGFAFGELIEIQSASIALFSASVLLLIGRIEPEDMLEKVEWTTIFFFGGLFILVGALESIGVIEFLAGKVLIITQGSISLTTTLVLWMSALLSSFLDNIPYVATMIPLVNSLSEGSVATYEPVWWALSIGACLGGNGTIIGASANVVSRGILEKHGFKISFMKYMKIAFPLMILSIIISTVYLLVFYL